MSTGEGFILGWILRGLFGGKSNSEDNKVSSFTIHSCLPGYDEKPYFKVGESEVKSGNNAENK